MLIFLAAKLKVILRLGVVIYQGPESLSESYMHFTSHKTQLVSKIF